MDRLGDAIAGRPIVSVLAAFVIGLAIAGGVAAAIAMPTINDLTDQRDTTSAQLAQALEARDQAQQAADQITGRRDAIIARAQDKAVQIVDDSKAQLSKLNGQIADARSELGSTQSRLNSVQASLQQAQATKAKSSFGDGTWQSGVDYLPGTYEAPGGGGCYWEKLNGPSGGGIGGIIDNGGFNKHQIVSVNSPYFHTSDCGTWTRVGG